MIFEIATVASLLVLGALHGRLLLRHRKIERNVDQLVAVVGGGEVVAAPDAVPALPPADLAALIQEMAVALEHVALPDRLEAVVNMPRGWEKASLGQLEPVIKAIGVRDRAEFIRAHKMFRANPDLQVTVE